MSDKIQVNAVDATAAASRCRLTLWIPQGEPQDTGSVCGNPSINGNELVSAVGTTAIVIRYGVMPCRSGLQCVIGPVALAEALIHSSFPYEVSHSGYQHQGNNKI